MGRYQPKCARDCLFIFVGKFEPTDCESLPVSSDFGANPQILDLPDEDVRRIGLGLFEKKAGRAIFGRFLFSRGEGAVGVLLLSSCLLRWIQRESRALERSYCMVGRWRRT